METATIPLGLLVFFIFSVLLLAAAIGSIFWMPGSKYGPSMPTWIIPVAYAALMLLTPFVLLVVTMMLFPCWWTDCP
jgi:hypothetical protein